MGTRRMFSRRITDSARFLKMGAGAQLLYFHLCMHADDDGVVEAYTVRRGIGANEDDMNNLIGRKLIKMLDAENEIVLITDWYEHNKIRKDRLTPSIYRPLIESIAPEVPLLEPTQRKDRVKQEPIDVGGQPATDGQPEDNHGTGNGTSHGQPWGNHGAPNGPLKISKDKLSQDKLSEDRTSKDNNGASAPTNRKRFYPPTVQDIQAYCQEKGYSHVDAEYFWNYYENINWHVGKNKMKSWKLAVANWEKRQQEFNREKMGNQQQAFIQHTEEERGGWADAWGLDDE